MGRMKHKSLTAPPGAGRISYDSEITCQNVINEKGCQDMSMNNLKKAPLVAAAVTGSVGTAEAARGKGVEELISKIKDDSAQVRTEAWQGAGEVGAPAVKPLAKVMTDENLEVARAAKRALWRIVRVAGRPGANKERRAVETELVSLLGDEQPVAVRREVIWMLSEVGARNSIKPFTGLLRNKDLREDARMALERIPTKRAVTVLKAAFEKAPEDFKPNIAQSLRKRGEEVAGYPCQKLVPRKKTDVKPL
jgi:HEAT repeat protein